MTPQALPTWIDPDEHALATLCARKLVKILQGTLSLGLPAILTGTPQPDLFLDEQFRLLLGHAEVLHAIAGKIGASAMVLRLRAASDQLRLGLRALQRALGTFAARAQEAGGDGFVDVQRTTDEVCRTIEIYNATLEMNDPRVAQVQRTAHDLLDALPALAAQVLPVR